jgi:hypothetical protein
MNMDMLSTRPGTIGPIRGSSYVRATVVPKSINGRSAASGHPHSTAVYPSPPSPCVLARASTSTPDHWDQLRTQFSSSRSVSTCSRYEASEAGPSSTSLRGLSTTRMAHSLDTIRPYGSYSLEMLHNIIHEVLHLLTLRTIHSWAGRLP